jgi:CubicO group peptidase (beta-lactamase class C family)
VESDEFLTMCSKGAVVFRHAEGVEENAIFRIFSMTKPITSVALMQLVEEGRLQLSDPVSKFLPSFADDCMHVYRGPAPDSGTGEEPKATYAREPVRAPITIQQLLTHTSGLSHGLDMTGLVSPVDGIYADHCVRPIPSNSEADSLAQYVALLSTMPLVHQPGEAWCYSVATDVAARVIEVVTGTSIESFFKERIFDPLGMIGM